MGDWVGKTLPLTWGGFTWRGRETDFRTWACKLNQARGWVTHHTVMGVGRLRGCTPQLTLPAGTGHAIGGLIYRHTNKRPTGTFRNNNRSFSQQLYWYEIDTTCRALSQIKTNKSLMMSLSSVASWELLSSLWIKHHSRLKSIWRDSDMLYLVAFANYLPHSLTYPVISWKFSN